MSALLALYLFATPLPAQIPKAPDPTEPWRSFESPAAGNPEAIGGTSKGCLTGGKRLENDGPNHQIVSPQRGRSFGHPILIDFLQDFSKALVKAGERRLLVGDLSQPRGGPAPGGHASHQSGIDVDLWYGAPPKKGKLSRKQLQGLAAPKMVDDKGNKTRAWSRRVPKMLALAANDPRVDRIFVNPGIKRALCESTKAPNDWLRKIRPWWSHDTHFHVRLACPAESVDCEPQEVLPAGTGCAELSWWFDEKAQQARKESRERYRDKIEAPDPLPTRCTDVAAAP